MINIQHCKDGIFIGLFMSATPLVAGLIIASKKAIPILITGIFKSVITFGMHPTVLNAISLNPQIWTLTYCTSCIGLPIAAISLLALTVLCSKDYFSNKAPA